MKHLTWIMNSASDESLRRLKKNSGNHTARTTAYGLLVNRRQGKAIRNRL